MEHNYDLKESLKDNPDVIEIRKLKNKIKFSKELGTSLFTKEDEIRLAELKEKLRLEQENYKYSGVGMRHLKATPQKPKPKENFISKFFKIFR